MNYRPSKVFGNLKVITETLDKNYSSSQYINVLDYCIYKAIRPIIESTYYIDNYLCKVLFWYIKEQHKKISQLDIESLSILIYAYLSSNDIEDKYKCFVKMKLDRSLLLLILNDYVKIFENVQFSSTYDSNLLEKLYSKNRDVEPCIQECNFWFNLSIDFKNQIKEKYTRMVILEAKNQYVQSSHRLDLDDLCQEYLLYLDKAISKYSSDKGTLTSYIQKWIVKVKNLIWIRLNSQEYSYDSLIENVDIESNENIENSLISKNSNIRVQQLCQLVDPSGLGRLFLGIPLN